MRTFQIVYFLNFLSKILIGFLLGYVFAQTGHSLDDVIHMITGLYTSIFGH